MFDVQLRGTSFPDQTLYQDFAPGPYWETLVPILPTLTPRPYFWPSAKNYQIQHWYQYQRDAKRKMASRTKVNEKVRERLWITV